VSKGGSDDRSDGNSWLSIDRGRERARGLGQGVNSDADNVVISVDKEGTFQSGPQVLHHARDEGKKKGEKRRRTKERRREGSLGGRVMGRTVIDRNIELG